MKTVFLVVDVVLGSVVLYSFIEAIITKLRSDQIGFRKAVTVFAVCVGALAILFVVAAIFDIRILPDKK
jgi:hypothetical protein